MTEIKIADKPTLDSIKALIQGSGINGYSNITGGEITLGTPISITGKGILTLCGLTMSISVLEIDGADIKGVGTNIFKAIPFYKSAKIKIDTAKFASYIVHLV